MSAAEAWDYAHMLILRRQILFRDNMLAAVSPFSRKPMTGDMVGTCSHACQTRAEATRHISKAIKVVRGRLIDLYSLTFL